MEGSHLPLMVEAEKTNPPCSHPLTTKGQAYDLSFVTSCSTLNTESSVSEAKIKGVEGTCCPIAAS